MANFQETCRTVVTAEQCDHLGHFNVQHYVAVVNEGAIELMGHIGLSPAAIAERQIAFAAVHMELDFQREVTVGDEIVLESAIDGIGHKSITVLHRLRHEATGTQAMAVRVTAVLMDLESRRAMPIPDDVRASALALSGRLT